MSSLSVGALIGEGAYGSVHHAYWQGRKVAMKEFRMTHASAASESALLQEVRLLESLRDKHIIQFYGTTEYNGHLVLVMEYADGGSLEGAIERGRLDWPNKIRIAQEVVRGLAYIHHMDVLHRDLKSMNILLTRALDVKLCDFGLATVKARSASKASSTKGTLRWMAPELFAVKPKYSTKSDIFALGMVMWELAANCTTPFRHQPDNYMALSLVRSGEREVLPDDTPSDYRQWVERCWDQDPDKRPEASEMVTRDDEPVHDHGATGHGTTVYITDSVLSMSLYSFSEAKKGSEKTSDVGNEMTDDMEALLAKAKAGDIEAQIALVSKYEKDDGANRSDVEALKRYLRTAEQGSIDAQFTAGDYFRNGRGTRENQAVAVYWFQKAAEGGHAVAQNTLGWMYHNGHGVERDYDQAASWYRKSADQGEASAQRNLGWMYQYGLGVEQDYTQAVSWYRKSANQGDAMAQNNLGLMYHSGYGVERDYAQAASWYRKSADQGDALGQNSIGWMYHNGQGVEQDHKKAALWYRKSADQGNASAQNSIGWMYQNGLGVTRDYMQAVSWYRKSAEQGDASGQCNLGVMYQSGYGVEQDYDQAASWYRKSAKQGYDMAQRNLKLLDQNGAEWPRK